MIGSVAAIAAIIVNKNQDVSRHVFLAK